MISARRRRHRDKTFAFGVRLCRPFASRQSLSSRKTPCRARKLPQKLNLCIFGRNLPAQSAFLHYAAAAVCCTAAVSEFSSSDVGAMRIIHITFEDDGGRVRRRSGSAARLSLSLCRVCARIFVYFGGPRARMIACEGIQQQRQQQ